MNSFNPTTHAVTLNGTSRSEVTELLGSEKMIRNVLGRLDGESEFAVSLWRLPEGKRLWDELPVGWPWLFVQAAGSAERMMIEVRQENPDGSDNLYKIGRRFLEGSSVDVVQVPWRDRVDEVPENETFEATEAGDIFWHYYQHGSVPEGYVLRVFD